jgi:hypothetical protein
VNYTHNLQPGTEEALRQIQERITLLKQDGGKGSKTLTDPMRQQWSESVATVLADPDCSLEPLLQDLTVLPGNVMACGAVSAWPSMSDDRKITYLRWVEALGSDKSGPQKIVLITKLLRVSPATSVELLGTVSLANKELKTRLASSLLGDSARNIGFLLSSDIPDYKIRKVLICLLQLCDAPKLHAEARWGTIRVVLGAIVSRKFHEDSQRNSVLDPIGSLLPSLPPPLQEKARSYLAETAPQLIARYFPEVANKAQLTEAPPSLDLSLESPPTPISHAALPAVNEKQAAPRSGLVQQLADWLVSLRGQSKLLEDLLVTIESLEEGRSMLESELQRSKLKEQSVATEAAKSAELLRDAKEQIQRLEDRLGQSSHLAEQAQERAAGLDARLRAAREEEVEVRRQLQVLEERTHKERTELHERVQTNADRRLDEFRNSLASSLARLLQGLPKRGISITDKDAEVILIRIYEIVALLGSKGIHINVGQGESR